MSDQDAPHPILDERRNAPSLADLPAEFQPVRYPLELTATDEQEVPETTAINAPSLLDATVNFAAAVGIPLTITIQSRRGVPGHGHQIPETTRVQLLDRAVGLVVRHATAAAVSNVEWEDYPEIGEHDWQAVLTRLDRLHPFPPSGQYYAACGFLAARAAVSE